MSAVTAKVLLSLAARPTRGRRGPDRQRHCDPALGWSEQQVSRASQPRVGRIETFEVFAHDLNERVAHREIHEHTHGRVGVEVPDPP